MVFLENCLIILMIVLKKTGKILQYFFSNKTNHLECKDYPYQSIDSGLFYDEKQIEVKLKENKNISGTIKNIRRKKNYLNRIELACSKISEINKKNYITDVIGVEMKH